MGQAGGCQREEESQMLIKSKFGTRITANTQKQVRMGSPKKQPGRAWERGA